MRRGKRYKEAAKVIDRNKLYAPEEALPLENDDRPALVQESVPAHI